MSSPRLTPLTDATALSAWIARSHREPVIIFKHSLTCGTSAAALEELEHFVDHVPNAPPCGLIVVQTQRAVANEAAELLGIVHQSPQAFVVVDGRVAWHASHWRITSQALTAAMNDVRATRA